jgi:hypothetical protein
MLFNNILIESNPIGVKKKGGTNGIKSRAKPKQTDLLEDQRIDGTLIMNLENIKYVDKKWINLALVRGQWCALVTMIMSRLGPIKYGVCVY